MLLSVIFYILVITSRGVYAWLPGRHRDLISRDGLNLFDRNALFDTGQLSSRHLPNSFGNNRNKIRGVNLGLLFVLENWLADNIMKGWKCKSRSEFDCVQSLHDQATANGDFQSHWSTWITQIDFTEIVSYGLNTVRIPVGYWLFGQLVEPSEYFPQGGLPYLDDVVSLAKDAGLYVIIDLHGAPGAQSTGSSTGQVNPTPAFYDSYNYNRTYTFSTLLAQRIHTNPAYSNVGMFMVMNEPERIADSNYPSAQSHATSLINTFYPTVIRRIRDVESSLNISDSNRLHVQMMDSKWGSGSPATGLMSTDQGFTAYDDHNYIKYIPGLPTSKDAYLSYSCFDDRSGPNSPVIVGEWSLSPSSAIQWNPEWNPWNTTNIAWYRKWWAAQVLAYEKVDGWIFWTWKTSGSLNDPRWDYRKAVAAGLIPKDIDEAYTMGACNGVKASTSESSGRSLAGKNWLTSLRRRRRMF